MSILERGKRPPATVHCVSEVHVDIPRERLETVVDFYTRLIGLATWPAERQIPGGWGAGDPQRGAYFAYRHDPHVDPLRRRFAVLVGSLDQAEVKLSEAACTYWRERGLGVTDQRILVIDPVGHVVELRQLQPL